MFTDDAGLVNLIETGEGAEDDASCIPEECFCTFIMLSVNVLFVLVFQLFEKSCCSFPGVLVLMCCCGTETPFLVATTPVSGISILVLFTCIWLLVFTIRACDAGGSIAVPLELGVLTLIAREI